MRLVSLYFISLKIHTEAQTYLIHVYILSWYPLLNVSFIWLKIHTEAQTYLIHVYTCILSWYLLLNVSFIWLKIHTEAQTYLIHVYTCILSWYPLLNVSLILLFSYLGAQLRVKMRLHIGVDAEHLVQMLGMNLQKEQEQWKPKTYKSVDANSSVSSHPVSAMSLVYPPDLMPSSHVPPTPKPCSKPDSI